MFDCSIAGKYESPAGDFIEDLFEGKIIPQGERAAALLRIPSNFHGSMIIHFDELNIVAGGKTVQSMGGVMVTAIGGSRSSAWPVLASRVNSEKPLKTSILTREDIKQLPAGVLEAMDRGAVHWKAAHYPPQFRAPS